MQKHYYIKITVPNGVNLYSDILTMPEIEANLPELNAYGQPYKFIEL